ncbi:response regulator [Paenibacillus sp. N3.4]|uniref:response regulator n=1 Tax=Paenibacillus sp. N3.4 TaxID=2603222 RepID=UPI0011CC88D0|nr:response regulator [Paenibacillus sp. N3.4]TXK83977.1 response regulator [Paenibacillus sp. N3.4]
MNILIVDDEPIIRQWFAMTIEKIGSPYRIVGEAGNGVEALQFCQQQQVDLVVTDIKMPQMDGIDLLKQLQQEHPHVRSLILSSYGEFEYAAEALKHGASDYLLKAEVTTDSLRESFDKIRRVWMLEHHKIKEVDQLKGFVNENQVSLRSVYLLKLFEGKPNELEQFHKQMSYFQVSLSEKQLTLFAVGINLGEHVKIKERELRNLAIINIIDETLKDEEGNGCSFSFDDNLFVALLNVEQTSTKTQRERLFLNANQISNHLNRFLGITSSIGISRTYHTLTQIPVQWSEAKEALQHRMFYGERSIVFYLELHHTDRKVAQQDVKTFLSEFARRVDAGDTLQALEQLRLFFQEIEWRKHWSDKQVKAVCVELIIICLQRLRNLELLTEESAALYENVHIHIQQQVTFAALKLWVTEKAQHLMGVFDNNLRKYCEPVMQACSYIKQHYQEEISLQQLAGHVHLSRTYFCELFKKETEISFNDYLTEIRMEKAKELLKNKDLKIGTLAEIIGYSNASYFIKLFRKSTNLSPLEYREHLYQSGK